MWTYREAISHTTALLAWHHCPHRQRASSGAQREFTVQPSRLKDAYLVHGPAQVEGKVPEREVGDALRQRLLEDAGEGGHNPGPVGTGWQEAERHEVIGQCFILPVHQV